MSEFTPAQLDAMEDALEELEELGIPSALRESDDPGDIEAAMRLGQFREILALSHDVFPLEDPPAGVLDAVFAEARASVEAEPVVATASEETAQPWWKKLKAAFLIPALAVAGSTALILWMVTPAAEDGSLVASAEKHDDGANPAPQASTPGAAADAELAEAEKMVADGRLADAAARREGGAADPFALEGGEARGNGLAESEDLQRGRLLDRGDDAPAAPVEEEATDEEDADETVVYDDKPASGPPVKAKKKRASTASGSSKNNKSGGKAMPAPEPVPSAPAKPKPAPKTDSPKQEPGGGTQPEEPEKPADMSVDPWQLLAKGDAARRGGSCGSARTSYRQVQDSQDKKARARAFAGLGLCEEAAGNTGVAQKYYSRARGLDPSVSKFIEAERPRPKQQADEPVPQQAQPPQQKNSKKQ
jgi:hypothetical protein